MTGLRCETLPNPEGIDVITPRLAWRLAAKRRGARQTACQILVASTEAKLKSGQADLWDTGKVESNQSIQVAYGGRELASGQRCYWKVRVWDKDGQLSPWSEPGW